MSFRLVACTLLVVAVAAVGAIAAASPDEGLMVEPIFVESVAEATQDLAATLGSAARTEVGGACPLEALKRVGLCTKILRKFLAPDPTPGNQQVVPFATNFDSNALCAKVVLRFPAVNRNVCLQMANHIRIAGGGYSRILATSRTKDIHDQCVGLLSTNVNLAPTPRWITPEAAASCSLAATGGITGLRVLMLHGMGAEYLIYRGSSGNAYIQQNDGWLGSWPKYWAPEDNMDGLADVRYYVTETNQRGWNNLALQREYCAAINKFRPHAIFTHSMGNMIVSAAILNRIPGCTSISKTPGPNSVMWFSNQAPWLGSPVATATVNACKGGARTPVGIIRQGATRLASSCNNEPATQSLMPSMRNTVSPAIQLANLKANANALVSGSLCGYSANPLNAREFMTLNGAGLWALCRFGSLTTMVQWGVDSRSSASPVSGNDGLVGYSSCHLDGQNYQQNPQSPFYAGALSHEDGPCLVADGRNPAQQPCSWFAARAAQARRARGLEARAVASGQPSLTVAPVISANQFTARFAQVDLDSSAELTNEQLADMQAELEAGLKAEALAAAAGEVETATQEHMEAEADAEVDAESDADADAEVDADAEGFNEEHDHAHLELQMQHAAELQAEAQAQAKMAAEAKAKAFAALQAQMAAEAAVEAESELVAQGLLEAPSSPLEHQDARLHAEVVMELQHQRDLDEQMAKEATELEAQIEAEISE